MTPEERDRIRRSHPRWVEFEAYYAHRHRTRWRRRAPWLAALAVLVVAAVLTMPGREPSTVPAPGGTCTQPGATTTAPDGRRLDCTTTNADRTPRWRTGQLDLPTR